FPNIQYIKIRVFIQQNVSTYDAFRFRFCKARPQRRWTAGKYTYYKLIVMLSDCVTLCIHVKTIVELTDLWTTGSS
ncbi:hypothetical protein L9F63_011218, partial [Diploptera punctata]